MPHLSKKISSSVALYEDGSSTSISNLEMDMSTYESRSKEYFYQKSVKAALEANKDINENEDGVTNVTYTDPLPFWVKEAQSSCYKTTLAHVAEDLLLTPVTSVCSERMFSISGILSSNRSSNISPEFLERRILLKTNQFF